jgi:hypothetical protein
MTRRARTRRPDYTPGSLLDWSDGRHWSGTELPCRYCGSGTHLRDSRMKPAHKVCAEDALTTQAAEAAAAYEKGTL